MKTTDKILVIAIRGGNYLYARVKKEQVRATDEAIRKSINDIATIPRSQINFIHIADTDNELPILTCPANEIAGWCWSEYRENPGDRMADVMEKAVAPPSGDEWKNQ